jgi:Fe-S-cluster containining protein
LGKHEEILATIAQEEIVRAALESKDIKSLITSMQQDTQGAVLFQQQFILNSLKDGCRGCSKCCEICDVDLNFYDVERLAAYLKIPQQTFISRYCTKAPLDELYFFRLKAKPCIFLANNRCTVYQQRPTKCVLYPFISGYQEENIRKHANRRIVITVSTWCNSANKAIKLLQKLKA